MEGLLPIVILFGASAGLLAVKHSSNTKRKGREGYQSIVKPSIARNFGADHADFIQKSASKYSKGSSLLDPLNNVLLPPNFTTSDVKKAENDLHSAIHSPYSVASEPSVRVKPSRGIEFILNAGGEGTALNAIGDCEAIKKIDCSAFDKKSFSLNCGMCFQDGQTGSGAPQFGGLYVSEDDKVTAEAMAAKMNTSVVNYAPTVGKCAPNMFVTSKAQCINLKNKLACQTSQTFNGAGCSQCYQDSTFKYLAEDLATDDPQLIVVGTGKLVVTKAGSNDINTTIILTSEPQIVDLPGLVEADALQLNVTPASASLAGFLMGLTASGDFRIDITRVIQSDTITGSTPRMAGVMLVGQDSYTVLRPGRGKPQMNLVLINPFTFINASEQEAIDCGATPYIKNESSATFLESSPCFKKGQKPGTYSMECLQQTFIGAGCTTTGLAYPRDDSTAAKLMADPNTGKMLKIGQIAGNVYNASKVAYTGINEDGSKLKIPEWDKVSRYCTGRPITSPCDFDDKVNGPLSKDCLVYLWNNEGAIDDLPGNVGPTYSGKDGSTSLYNKNKRYCTSGGAIAPVDKDGKVNQVGIDIANRYKGVDAVKAYYNSIHMAANDNTKKDDERKQAINMCYGVDLLPLPTQKVDTNTDLAMKTTCSPETIAESVTCDRANIQVGSAFELKKNLILKFTINPASVGSTIQNVLCLSKFGAASIKSDPGVAAPKIMINKNGILSIFIVFSDDSRNTFTMNTPLVASQDNNIQIIIGNNTMTVVVSGATADSASWRTGPFPAGFGFGMYVAEEVSTVSPNSVPLRGSLKNISYCTYDSPYTSVLDSITGRTKTTFQEPVIPKSTLVTMSESFNEGGNAFDWGGATQRFAMWINKQTASGDDNLYLIHMKKQFDKNGGKLKILLHKYDAKPEHVVDRVLEINDFIELGPLYWQIQSTYRSSYQYGMYYPYGCRLEITIVDPSTPISPSLG
jgi:hypothetical protein